MALTHKAKKRLALLILLVGLPAYIAAAWYLASLFEGPNFERPSLFVELAIYLGLGVLWAWPFKAIFRGVGQPDPNEKAEGE